jgi:ribosomal protein S18 acetylase RimI-like enzyme
LDPAVEVFVQAYSRIKSQHYPYPADRVDGLWVLHDVPVRKGGRKTEVVACGLLPKDAVSKTTVAELGWHFLCHISPSEDETKEIRDAYKSLGYRAISTEWMFVHDLKQAPDFVSDPPVREVLTQENLDQVKQAANHKLRLMPGSRLFGIFDETRDYGWVRSVAVGSDAWVSNLFVHAPFRGRGYGRALMSTLLQSDKEHGVENSVLLASSSGARLYPHLGYRQIAILQMFCPADRTKFKAR